MSNPLGWLPFSSPAARGGNGWELEPLERASVLGPNILNGVERLNGLTRSNKLWLFAVV
jgi:hypothetical protein